ncbi:23S rRNA 2'-O-ribose G2251 methyltransferase [Gammaproteobacteria bacterium]
MDTETLIYGVHAVRAALAQGRVRNLWLDASRQDARLQAVRTMAATLPCQNIERKVLDAMVPGVRHQGVVARCLGQALLTEDDLPALLGTLQEPAFLLVLDGVQDPHNLGACLRNADAAGVHAVIAPRDRAAGLTPAVRKVASGAAEVVPFVQVTNLARALRTLKENGMWLVGADGNASQSLYEVSLTGPLVLVMGTEGRGLRRLSAELCDFLVHIPMLGTVESLNVSVASGICLFEALRQRQLVPKKHP